ncbi:S49 family peptidase [Mesorhizobium sp. B2-5-3]|uniref:S49 family peptidase n=1 Tax=Mesorhizobium sp. B2-5-3 TaxID=2589927 RepID=UPI0015E2A758|nr:S49 family peptidase [Mesorhizobium sp. B2-5-3]
MPDINLSALAMQFMQGLNLATSGSLSLWAVRKDALSESLGMVRMVRTDASKNLRAGEPLAPGSFATRIGTTAVVPIFGPLMARMNREYWSYEEIIRDLRLAAADPGTTSILLDVDSPGGTVSGIDTAAAEIARTASLKPMVAHIGGMGCSAAYWLPSAAGEIVASRTSLIGSVGALIRYADLEGILTKLGANIVEVIASQSPNKRLDPNSEEGRQELQAIADHGAEMFISALAEARNTDRETIMGQYGQGLVFTAPDALGRGMIDRIASFEETLADLAARPALSRPAAAAAASAETKEVSMTTATSASASPALTLEALRASNPDLVAAIEASAREQATSAERERLAGIEANLVPGQEALIAAHKADANMTPAASAQAVLAAVKAKGTDVLKGLQALDRAAEGVASRPSEHGDAGASAGAAAAAATTPDGWKAEWEGSDKLKAEYPSAESYVATKKRDALKG